MSRPDPIPGGPERFRRITVDEYHRLIHLGILTEDDPIELLEGYLLEKLPRGPRHDFARMVLSNRLIPIEPTGWQFRPASAVTLADSEPEPDFVIARGDENAFRDRHPAGGDVGLVIEVADASLGLDRIDKARIYARAGIPIYWIVNIPDRRIEVYIDPSGPTDAPAYATRTEYLPSNAVPVVLDGTQVGTIAVSDVIR
jgi:Uma2 family endonuclease